MAERYIGRVDSMNNLNDFVIELYKAKDKLRDYTCRNEHKKGLRVHKDYLIEQIKKEMIKVSESKRSRIRKQLWDELGVLI